MKKIFFIIGVILTMAKGVQAQTCQVMSLKLMSQ